MRLSKIVGLSLVFLVFLVGVVINGKEDEENFITNSDFEEDIEGWKGYGGSEEFSQFSGEAYSGKYSLKVETPGEGSLEGAVIQVKVEPEENYFISAYVKGEGKVMICASGSGGWVYGKKVNLTSKWEKLEIEKFEKGSGITMDIITVEKQKITFYIDKAKVIKEEIPEMPAKEVKPIYYEAEDYPGNGKIVKDTSASGGAYAKGTRWYILAGKLPFPQTSTPTYIYLKTWISDNSEHHIDIMRKNSQILLIQKLPVSEKWVWVKTGPFTAKDIGKEFGVSTNGPTTTVETRLDAIVVTTKDELTDKELEAVEEK